MPSSSSSLRSPSVFSLGTNAAAQLLEYYDDLAGQSSEAESLSYLLRELGSILKHASAGIVLGGPRKSREDSHARSECPISRCSEYLKELVEEYDKIRTCDVRSSLVSSEPDSRRPVYPLQQRTILRLKEKVHAASNLLSQALHCDQQLDISTVEKIAHDHGGIGPSKTGADPWNDLRAAEGGLITHDNRHSYPGRQPSSFDKTQPSATHSAGKDPTDGESTWPLRRQSADSGVNSNNRTATSPDCPHVPSKSTEIEGRDGPQAACDLTVDTGSEKRRDTILTQIRRVLLSSWINLLLPAAPAGIVLYFAGVSNPLFAINFIALLPLGWIVHYATKQIASRLGGGLSELLNTTLGNIGKLVMSTVALAENEVTVVQTSLIGNMLAGSLLVLGICFLCGGLKRKDQFFNKTVAQTTSRLFALVASGLIVPTLLSRNVYISTRDISKLSRGTAVVLLLTYVFYLVFQFKTHKNVYNDAVPQATGMKLRWGEKGKAVVVEDAGSQGACEGKNAESSGEVTPPNGACRPREEPQLGLWFAIVTVAIAGAFTATCAEFAVGSLDELQEQGIAAEFSGLIILPVAGNISEYASAVAAALRDEIDQAIGIVIGSSMQVALVLTPLMMLIGWGLGIEEMNMRFDDFQVVVLSVAVLMINCLLVGGRSHWLAGALLIYLYVIIAICSWWYPVDDNLSIPGIQSH